MICTSSITNKFASFKRKRGGVSKISVFYKPIEILCTVLLVYKIIIQGVPSELLKSICLWESLKIQNMSWDWCFHFTEIRPFWDLVSKKFHNHSVIIHLWRLWRCIIAEISKYIENQWLKNTSIVLQISPQRKLRSSWNFMS